MNPIDHKIVSTVSTALTIISILTCVSIFLLIGLCLDPKMTSLGSTSISEGQEAMSLKLQEGNNEQDGLIEDTGSDIVRVNCTACHSAQLITQNKATREGWKQMIQWMQETQGLWNLGENESIILDYLAKNYAPEKKGRRANLENIEWYEMRD